MLSAQAEGSAGETENNWHISKFRRSGIASETYAVQTHSRPAEDAEARREQNESGRFAATMSAAAPTLRLAARRLTAQRTQLAAAKALPKRSLASTCRISAAAPLPPAGTPAPSPYTEPAGVNPADRTKDVQGPLNEFGAYITACLPKFIQQFSVYKDELCRSLTFFCMTGMICV